MIELLFAIVEMFWRFSWKLRFEFAAESIGALILRGLAAVFDTSEFKNPLLACVGYVFLGGVAGGLSLLFFPHPLVHRSRVPGLSVVISPVLAAWECQWWALHYESGTGRRCNRELWVWICICIRNGPRPLLLRQMNIGFYLADKREKSAMRSFGYCISDSRVSFRSSSCSTFATPHH